MQCIQYNLKHNSLDSGNTRTKQAYVLVYYNNFKLSKFLEILLGYILIKKCLECKSLYVGNHRDQCPEKNHIISRLYYEILNTVSKLN